MSKEISYGNLVYDFEGPTPSINFGKYGGPMSIYGHMKNGEKTLPQLEEQQKYFKKDLIQIASGNPKHKNEKQSYAIKNIKNLSDSRQKIIDLLIMIMQKLDMKPFTNQIKMKLKKQDLKYYHQNKSFKDYQNQANCLFFVSIKTNH